MTDQTTEITATSLRAEVDKLIDAWTRVHANACRLGDHELREQATRRIGYWSAQASALQEQTDA